jgi:ABC-type nitrate/sulfonate/bicarbonate transport system permease component
VIPHRIAVLGTRIAIIVGLLAIWEIAARFFVSRNFISPPSIVFTSYGRLFQHEGVAQALGMLLVELTSAFCLAVIIGTIIALAIASTEFSRRSFTPIILLLYATPQITILPIVILLTGVGPASKIVFGTTHGMFPVIITVLASLRSLKPVLSQAAFAMGANRWQRFRYMLLPHMLPSFFTAMRLAMVTTLLGVLVAELYASSRGIGFFTRLFTDSFDPTALFGLISIIALMAIVINELLRRAELKASAWRRS